MGLIKNRIDSEYRKHKSLDWSKLAEIKILLLIRDLIDNAPDGDYIGEYLKDKLKLNNLK